MIRTLIKKNSRSGKPLNAKDLASFNTGASAWIADAGKYEIKIGASSEDIKLSKPFSLTKKITIEKVNSALIPQVTINELKPGKP